MKMQKTIYHYHSTTRILLVFGIIIVINILLGAFSFRLDLTKEKQYTLAKPTKDMIRGLKNPITIKMFMSKNIPEFLLGTRQDIMDLLTEYKKIGTSNVIIEYLDPKQSTDIANEANSYGIVEIQFNTFGQEKFEISSGYFGLAILYQDKSEPLPVIQNTDNLEYDITAAIQKLAREKIPVLGIMSGHGENLDQNIRRELEKLYTLKDVSVIDGTMVEPDVDIILIIGPTQTFSQRELFVMDQHVMAGKSLIVLADGVLINKDFFTGNPNNINVNTLLNSYGVSLNSDVVIDLLSQEALQFRSGFFVLIRPYPAWPKIIGRGLDSKNPITSKLRSLTFPWPSSLTILPPKDNTSRQITELLKTSPQSYTLSNETIILNPEALEQQGPATKQSYTLAALISGTLQSAFTGKEIPQKGNNGEKNVNKSLQSTLAEEPVLTTTDQAKILVVSSAQFLQTNLFAQSPENFIFFANALDAMAQGQSLIEIRSRNAGARPIKNLSDAQKNIIRYTNILSGAILSLLVGAIFYLKRKRAGKRAQEIYSS